MQTRCVTHLVMIDTNVLQRFSEVKILAERLYEEVHVNWYKPYPEITGATLWIELSDAESGYSCSEDTIYIRVPSGNVMDHNALDETGWPLWKSHLIHEMLHEYQQKIVLVPTVEGQALYKLHQKAPHIPRISGGELRGFTGRGHDVRFYTAIVLHAKYFEMTPEKLLRQL